MTRTTLLIEEIAQITRRIAGGDVDDTIGERVTELLTRARLVAKGANEAEIKRLLEATDAMAVAVSTNMERIAGELRGIGTRRSALSAYGSMRTHHSAQNLRTRV